MATLERLRPLVVDAEYVVPGHGPMLDSRRALTLLAEDRGYLLSLRDHGVNAELPVGRRSDANRSAHAANVLIA